ncbi:MAG: hypothetical protein ACFFDF_13035 [Candidatus Odinarchaeota archaeon]
MEKVDFGNNLIVIGLIIYILVVPLYIISAMVWGIAPIGFVLDCILIITGLTCIIIGGKWAKKSKDYWLVITGLILVLGSLFLEAINISANIFGLRMFIPFPISLIILSTGIFIAIIGGLMKKR